MCFDYSKLRGRIIEKFGNQSKFAVAMGWSERTMSLKITGKRYWKQPEMCLALTLLELSDSDVAEYFFKTKVQNTEPKEAHTSE